MTAPDSPMISRSDASAMMPEAVGSFAQSSQTRRRAGTRARVEGDGKVIHHADHRHIGTVYKTGMAWRARDPKGQQVGLHASKLEATGALVQRHEAC